TATGASGRFIQGPLQAFLGATLQTVISPVRQTGANVNVGIQLTPNSAHSLTASLNLFRALGSESWNETATISYAYHFGNAIHPAPLFEFLSRGSVEGKVCYDKNSDGICSDDELPLADVEVRLSSGAKTKTDKQGHYRFGGLKPGYYHIDV